MSNKSCCCFILFDPHSVIHQQDSITGQPIYAEVYKKRAAIFCSATVLVLFHIIIIIWISE
jgi:hypothetical protein